MAVPMGAFNSWSSWWNYVRVALGTNTAEPAPWVDQYDYLRSYYLANGLYDVLRERFKRIGYGPEQIKPLRNPSYRVVEFYAAKMWPGPVATGIPLVGGKRQMEAVEQIWQWSNLATEKQAMARNFPMYGDLFLKVATRSNAAGAVERVYIQNLEPQTVTELDTDERSYVTYIRLDIPQYRRKRDGTGDGYTLTEVWNKAEQSFQRWKHKRPVGTTLDQLGAPVEARGFAEFGIDFVPIVWQPFRHIGDQRGMAAITPALDKIDEANRQATRLHQMLFRYNKPLWAATAGGNDATGRPLPPPRLGIDGAKLELSADPNTDDIVRLPGMAALTPLVPSVDYAGALEVIRDQMSEIRQDLPEMVYSQLQERSDLSGVAIRYLLEAAIDRAVEARGNGDAALVRANQMALTIGQTAGLFAGLGTYEAGDFEHQIGPRPVLSLAELDRAQIVATYVGAGIPAGTAARRAGWTNEEITAMATEKADADAKAQAGIAAAMLNAQEQFDRGQPVEDTPVEGDQDDAIGSS